jgi:hypothetical protein
MIEVKKPIYDKQGAFLRMQTEASRAGTYARQAAYQKQHCLKTIKFEDKANKISGSVKKH